MNTTSAWRFFAEKAAHLLKRCTALLLPHAVIVLSGMFVVLWILDRYNPTMGFISSHLSKTLLLILFVLALVNAVWQIVRRHRHR